MCLTLFFDKISRLRIYSVQKPIAFLNLDNGEEQELEAWHWLTIAFVYYFERKDAAWIEICDEGIVKRIDLKLWLEVAIAEKGCNGTQLYTENSCCGRTLQIALAVISENEKADVVNGVSVLLFIVKDGVDIALIGYPHHVINIR